MRRHPGWWTCIRQRTKPVTKSLLVLFDLDRTLIESGGAGRAALQRAFVDVCGIHDDLSSVGHDGKTDRATVERVLALYGHSLSELGAVRDRYLSFLVEELAAREGAVLPGVTELLAALSSRSNTAMGLATGNFREGAMQKLHRYDLDRWLPDGGYGDNYLARADVVRDGINRLRRELGGTPSVLVFGDTPHDMQAAIEAGATAFGVATGSHSAESLTAAGAHQVFGDLSDLGAVLEAMER